MSAATWPPRMAARSSGAARAVMRAELWDVEKQVAAAALPSPGEVLKAAKEDFDRETYDREWPERAAKTMW